MAGELDAERTTAAASGDDLTGDLVVLAVWYPVTKEVVSQYGDALAGKVVIDISNPVNVETFDGLVTPPDSSAAEELAKLGPAGAQVVKAFNTTFAGTLLEAQVAGQPLDVLIAGDDAEAKSRVSRFVEDAGLRPIDVGPLRRARELEALGFRTWRFSRHSAAPTRPRSRYSADRRAFASSKAALLALTRSAAVALGPLDIRVNAVSPGLVWRDGLEQEWPEGLTSWNQRAPFGKPVLGSEVAEACAFLASPASSGITGEEITMDRGHPDCA